MRFKWLQAEELFRKLDRPCYGDHAEWMRWYEEAWSHLAENGLTDVNTPLDDVRVRLRIFSLAWIANDFCAAVLAEEKYLYWSEWVATLEINPAWTILTISDFETVRSEFAETPIVNSEMIEFDDEIVEYDDREISNDLLPRLVTIAADQQRDDVSAALLKGYGDDIHLFARMYACCMGIDDVISERKSELEDLIDDLQLRISGEISPEDKDRLCQRIDDARQQLDEKSLRQFALDQMMEQALGEPVTHGDDESLERMNGYEWCEQGCPVTIRGIPEFSKGCL